MVWEKYVFKCLCLISEILGFKAPRHLIYGVGGRERGVMKGETNNTDDHDDDDGDDDDHDDENKVKII